MGIRRAKLDVLHDTDHPSQQSRRYGVHLGHSASQAGLASTHGSPNTAVPALRCPSWAFGEPSWTCYTTLTTHHSSPGVTVSILGIRRAKLDVLHATDHCLCACHLEHCGGAASTRCKCCTVMSCGARRQKQDRSTGTLVLCARVSEGTLRTGTSMHCMIQWLFTFPANSLYRSCSCFDECSMM